jgi:hypothetical protein
MNSRPVLSWLAACALSVLWLIPAQLIPAQAADAIFPLASRIGMVPPAGLTASKRFLGFEDRNNNVFIRLIALPGKAFAEIEKSMTNDGLRKQGMTVEKRESFVLPSGKGLLLVARQNANSVRILKWLLIAPFGDLTALASFEMPTSAAERYPDATVRAALATLTARSKVPDDEQLSLLPFRVSEMAGMRLVRVVPGTAAQLTDGPKDTLDASKQPHIVISVAAGGPQRPGDRDHFARTAFSGLPPLKDVRISNSEPMRIGGQPGHEIRAQGKDPQTGTDIQIVQWLRFGSGGYLRILGMAPKQDWTKTFMRFRTVRDGLEPR